MRRSIPDMAVHHDQCGPVARFREDLIRSAEHAQVICIVYARDVPPITHKTRHHVFAKGPLGRTVQRHAVVIINPAKV